MQTTPSGITFPLITSLFVATSMVNGAPKPAATDQLAKLSLAFEPNRGQAGPQTRFVARAGGYALLLGSTETLFQFRGAVIRTSFAGAQTPRRAVGLDATGGVTNYLIGADSKDWRLAVPHFRQVRYEAIYPGIDLLFYGNPRELEYDFVVAPGADPTRIELVFEGVDALKLDARGDLMLRTAAGEMIQRRPVAYQLKGDRRAPVESHYRVSGRRVRIELAKYDRTLPLIVDPALAYSTYLGGSGEDIGTGIAVDSTGSAYITGSTTSADFPTAGAAQPLAGGSDVFVTRLNPSGSTILYTTFLGGAATDTAAGIAVGTDGSAYVTGTTASTNFPALNGFQATNKGMTDVFAAKLNGNGQPVWITLLGGAQADTATAIAVDGNGFAYLAGDTVSTDFPIQSPSRFPAVNGHEAFLTKLSTTGNSLVFSIYFGAGGDDYATAVAVDSLGSAYIAGRTNSPDFPVFSPIQAALAGRYDAFVAKFSSSAGALIYSTLLGGEADDGATGIAVDATGAAYVTGTTASQTFPTRFTFQGPVGASNSFVSKLSPSGNALVYSTYLSQVLTAAIAVDSSGSALVAGNRPGTDPFNFLRFMDVFVGKLHPDGGSYDYTMFFTGSDQDEAKAVALDSTGTYLTGQTYSTDFQLQSPRQAIKLGVRNAFVSKIIDQGTAVTVTSVPVGLTLLVDGQTITTPQTLSWVSGTVHTLSALSPQGDSGIRRVFVSWSDGGDQTHNVTAGSAAISYVANFSTQYQLTTSVTPAGRGVISATPASNDGYYPAGTTLVVTAVPTPGYQFLSFGGALTGGANPQNLVLDAPKSVSAAFSESASCSYALSKTVSQVGAAGESSSVNVIAPAGCTWTAASSVPWITIIAGAAGAGNGTVNYNVSPNPTNITRVGTITVVGQTLTITQAAAGVNEAPTPISVSPNGGLGYTQTFTFTFQDLNGFNDIIRTQIIFNTSVTGISSCLVYYDAFGNSLQLLSDTGVFQGPIAIGSAAVSENAQCRITGAGASVSGSGSQLSLSIPITFKTTFGGTKTVFAEALDRAGISSGYMQIGSWMVPPAVNVRPQVTSVTPPAGAGTGQTLVFQFDDANGAADIVRTQILFNDTPTGVAGCLVYFDRVSNALLLLNDAATAFGAPLKLGSAGTLQNSQCAINAAASSSTAANATLTLNLAVTFPTSFAGTKQIFAEAYDSGGLSTGYQQIGTYSVSALGNSTPMVVSVSPSSGSGASQTFTVFYSDLNGYTDIVQTQAQVGATGGPVCLVRYSPLTNELRLQNDGATGFLGPVTVGSTAVLENSQCQINARNSAASGTGNTLSVSYAISFKAAFSGVRPLLGEATDSLGATTGLQIVGTWTVNSATNQAPQVGVLSPNAGAGNSQIFNFQFLDANGATDIVRTQILFNSTFTGGGACLIYYDRASNTLLLRNDANTAWTGPIGVTTPGTLQNSQCIVDASGSTASSAGNTLLLNLNVTFKSIAFSGQKTVFAEAFDAGAASSGYQTVGQWIVP